MKYPPFTKLYNYIIDEYLPDIQGAEIKTLLVIFRKTTGWGRKRAKITRSYIMIKTGLSAKSVSQALKQLDEKKLIRILDGQGSIYPVHKRRYATDLHFEIRMPSRVKTTHTRVETSHSLEYKLPIIKERYKRNRETKKPPKRKLTDAERIQQILQSQHQH